MRRAHPYSPQTIDAVRVLGLEVARARRARRWTEAQLAERVGVSAVTLRNVERGVPTVGIGTVFEAATILGIGLFGADRDGLRSMVERGRDRLALLPARVREPEGPVRDDFSPAEAFVWAWLPGARDPVPAGRLETSGEIVYFTYGRSYLDRAGAIPLYLPELPLRQGRIRSPDGLAVAGCIRDAGPDAWGQRVILQRRSGYLTADSGTGDLSPLTYLLESGSDRIGALDFQPSATAYQARASAATLEEMVTAAGRLDAGLPLSPMLETALLHGTSVGGARPKVLLSDGDRRLIAKLSSRSDPYPVVRAEAVAMELARRAGLNVAMTEVTEVLGHDVLLVDRFDRTEGGLQRRMLVSALTILNLDVMMARYATYYDLADAIRSRFAEPRRALRELFSRIVFNICVSNTDDHARNHAAFWDGGILSLTPAYDICPQPRSGGEATQAMAIRRDGYRYSQLAGCIAAARDTYLLSKNEAKDIIGHQVDTIRAEWDEAADMARLTSAERDRLWGRQILNPYALQDAA